MRKYDLWHANDISRRIPDGWKSGIPALADTRCDCTRSSLNDVFRSTLERALRLVRSAGGTVTDTQVVNPEQAPEPGPLDQWDTGVSVSRVAVTDGAAPDHSVVGGASCMSSVPTTAVPRR